MHKVVMYDHWVTCSKTLSIDIDLLFRYIYYDNVEISPEIALPLMYAYYAAKKYMLSRLSKKYGRVLQTNINFENVWFLLHQSIMFSEDNLKDACLKFISRISDNIFRRKEFLTSSRQPMDAIEAWEPEFEVISRVPELRELVEASAESS